MSIKYLIGKRAAVIEYEECCEAEAEGGDEECDDNCPYEEECIYCGECSDDCEEYDTCENKTEAKKETRRWYGVIVDVAYSYMKGGTGLFLNVTMLRDNGEIYTWHINNTQELRLEGDEYDVVRNKLLNCVEEGKDEIVVRAELMDFED